MKVLERVARIEWREFLEAYSAVSRHITMWVHELGITANNLSHDRTALARIEYKAPMPVDSPTTVCLEIKPLLRGEAAEVYPCEYENLVPRYQPTARARLSAEKLRLWISEAERIEADHAVFEAAGERLRFYAPGRCECWVEDYAQAEGEAYAVYSLRYFKAIKRISKPAVLEFATDNPLHIRWEAPRVSFSLYLASLPRD